MLRNILSILFFFSISFNLVGQNLTISTGGQTGTSGTNWSITGNTLAVGASGSASIHPDVISDHLNNVGDLTVNLPWQSGQVRQCLINGSITYTGTATRTLTFLIANDILMESSSNSITSTNGALNVVLRAANAGAANPDNGRVSIRNTNTISTNGGHLWIGGGGTSTTWNGLTVGNSLAKTWADNVPGLEIENSTLSTNGGNIYLAGLSYNSNADAGENYGLSIENTSITSQAGSINIIGEVKGRFTYGMGTRIFSTTGNNTISSTSGNIVITGTGSDQATNGNGWRVGTYIHSQSSTFKNTISSTSGTISIQGTASFAATVNDKEGVLLAGTGLSIVSQTGNIEIKGSNSLETSGQFSNSIRFANGDVANAIRIGFDGTNVYSGNILIEGNSIYQRNQRTGTGSIAIQSTGNLTIQPTGNAFTFMRAGDSGTLTYDDDWNFGTNLGSFTLGKSTNNTNLTYSRPLTTAGAISIYGGNVFAQQNLTSTLSGAAILLQATGYINLTADRTIQTNNGDITFRANSGGTAVVLPNSTTGAITLNSGSSLLSTGGNITLGGNFDGTKGTGLYAASARVGGAPGILIIDAILNAAGGNINIYGRSTTSYDDGIRLQANISTTGAGIIGLYGDAFGGLASGSPDVWFGGITFITNPSTIETENGNINVEGVLTNTQNNGTYALNFYRSVYTSGTNTRDIQIISKAGDIQITGDRGTTSAGGMGSSSWGHIYFGSPLSGSWTASGDVKFTYSSFVGAGAKGFKVKTTGAVTYEPTATSFANAQTFPHNSNYVVAEGASSLTIGKASNTANITMAAATTVAGPITVYGGDIAINENLNTTAGTTSGNVLIKGSGDVILAASKSITTSGAPVILWANSDNASSDGSIALRNGSSIVTGSGSVAGGHVWIGGGSNGTTWNGLAVGSGYAVPGTAFTPSNGGGAISGGIYLEGSSINSFGGHVKLAGDASTSTYGILAYSTNSIDSKAGKIDLDANASHVVSTNSTGVLFGIHDLSIASTMNLSSSASNVAINISGVGRGTGDAIALSGTLNILSTGTGEIAINGNAIGTGRSIVAGNYYDGILNAFANSGKISLNGGTKAVQVATRVIAGKTSGPSKINLGQGGSITNSSSDVFITADNIALAASGIAVNSTGKVTIESSSDSFASALTFPIANLSLANTVSGLTLGKSTNTQNITFGGATSIAGPITAYGGRIDMGVGVNINTTTAAGHITLLAKNGFGTLANSGTTRGAFATAGGNIHINADADNNNSGQLDLDWLSINSAAGNIILEGSTFLWNTGSGVAYPEIYGTGELTFRTVSSGTHSINSTWLALFDKRSAITLGKANNDNTIDFLPCITCNATALNYTGKTLEVNGPITANGTTITISSPLKALDANINLTASTAVTQTAAITANGLALNGAGTFTLQNAANNIATIAGGSATAKLARLSYTDANGLTIGTVNPTGVYSVGPILIETLVGDISLEQNLSTDDATANAIIVNAGKNSAIGTATGGDIKVVGNPSITTGANGFAKLFSGSDGASAGLSALVGTSNVRTGVDENTTSFTPGLSAGKFALYRVSEGTGDLTIVSSGGDAEGTTWSYANGVIKTLSSPVNILNTVLQAKFASGDLSIEANKVTFNANITNSTSNAFKVLSKTHIINSTATTITTQGGDVLLASNVDDATDAESAINGQIRMGAGLTITTNGGDITLGGGNVTGTGYAMGATSGGITEGVRFDGIANLNADGGNITIRGKSAAVAVGAGEGAAGIMFYNIVTASINSGAGTILLDGYSQTSAGNAIAGILLWNSGDAGIMTIESANTTANAIILHGFSTANSGQSYGIEVEDTNTLNVYATGAGGGININAGRLLTHTTANENLDIVWRGPVNILADGGPISIKGGQFGGVSNGYLYTALQTQIGSKASTSVSSSTSDVLIAFDRFWFNGDYYPKIATAGAVSVEPISDSFGMGISSAWFQFNQNSQTMAGLTMGKSTNTTNLAFDKALSVAGPVTAYGGNIAINANLTSTALNSGIKFIASGNIVQGADILVQSNNGDITYWTNSDGVANDTDGDFIGLYSGVTINSANGLTNQSSGGGTITLAGGTTTQTLPSGTVVPTDYALSTRTTNWVDVLPPGGVNFGEKRSAAGGLNTLNMYSGGGDIVVKGKSNSSSAGVQWFSGSTGATQVINSGNGTISIDGVSSPESRPFES